MTTLEFSSSKFLTDGSLVRLVPLLELAQLRGDVPLHRLARLFHHSVVAEPEPESEC